MDPCCVCDKPATWMMSGAAVCGKEHGDAFYGALLPSEQEAVRAGKQLSELTMRYCKLVAGNLWDANSAINLTDRYANITLVGGGALGSLYQADDIGKNMRVFLRVFHPDDDIRDVNREMDFVVKLRREIEQHFQGAQLAEHLPEIYDAFLAKVPGYAKITYVISMEFIPGVSIGDYVHSMRKRGVTIGYRAWLRLFRDAFMLLEAMHSIKFVHGNLNCWNIFVRQPTADMEVLNAKFVVLDFRMACVGDCSKLYGGGIEYTSRDLAGLPFDRKMRMWLDGMSRENRVHVLELEDVYAMATVLFNVLAGVTISPLQQRILAVKIEYSGAAPPDNAKRVEEVNRMRRAAIQKLFVRSGHDENIDSLINSNLCKLTDAQQMILDDIYMDTIGAPLARRLTAAELQHKAYLYLDLKQ